MQQKLFKEEQNQSRLDSRFFVGFILLHSFHKNSFSTLISGHWSTEVGNYTHSFSVCRILPLPSHESQLLSVLFCFSTSSKKMFTWFSPTCKGEKEAKSVFTGCEHKPTSKKGVENVFLLLTRVSKSQQILGEFFKTFYLLKFSRYRLTFLVQYLLQVHLHRNRKCSENWVVKSAGFAVDFISFLKNDFLTFHSYLPQRTNAVSSVSL